MQNYKFLNQIVLWNVFFAIICIPTAGKLIDIMGIPLSISIYYFPFVYIFADITTEVYGYAVARRVLWYCIYAQLLVIAVFEFVILYPPSAVMTNNQSYVDVLSTAPRLVLFGTLAMFAGDIANNYVLAKMKVWTEGLYISARFVTSTLCGQMVNTTVFYVFGLWGMIPTHVLTKSIVVATLVKVSVELIFLPVTLKISLWLKRMENVDYFDRATNFNPLKF
ncbi:MAG TPA: queuosine precursor transporter [Candidatus Acidoferrales bacterium]|nr:queuosine precursor transporter [Candidatus Acidoferrales bacterium]